MYFPILPNNKGITWKGGQGPFYMAALNSHIQQRSQIEIFPQAV